MNLTAKLEYLEETKEKIRQALETKGVTVSDKITFRNYTYKIAQIGTILKEVSGKEIAINDSGETLFDNIKIYGNTTQNGTPTPEAPVTLESVENPVLTINGKNLLDVTAPTQTINGVTFTVNSDGTVTASGTASANAFLIVNNNLNLTAGEYILSGITTGSATTYLLQILKSDGSTVKNIITTELSFTLDTDLENGIARIVVFNGVTVDNLTFKPMIRLASITDSTYEPYKAQSLNVPYILNGVGDVRDYVDFERGVLVRNFRQVTVDGTSVKLLLMSATDNNGIPVLQVRISSDYGVSGKALCSHLEYNHNLWSVYPKPHFLMSDENGSDKRYFRAFFEGYSDINSLNASFANNPMTVIYQIAPTETPLTNEEIAAFNDLHTYKPNTVILNSESAEMTVGYFSANE